MWTTPTTCSNVSDHRPPEWYQLRCSGSSRMATSRRFGEVMYALTSPTGMMEYLSVAYRPG